MRNFFLSLALLAAFLPLAAQTKMEPWQDPNVFEENRMPMRATFVTAQQQTLSLNGLWKFHFNPTIEGRLRGFEAVGYDDAAWDEIPVPGLWDLNGYCDPMYLNVGYPWRGHYQNNPPYPATEHNYVGQYRRTFTIDKSWIGKQICLNIGSATSNVRVWVNGKMVGYSEDSKLEARFDLTKYVHAGENTIALEIFRWCDGTYLEDQDFWRFAGIARGVEVYTREKERIEDIHVTAGADGRLKVQAEVTKGVAFVEMEVLDPSGKSVLTSGKVRPVKGTARYEGTVWYPALWSAEAPNLYTLRVKASTYKALAENTALEFGFRTVEIVGNQLLVNGKPILIKGADRHELSPSGGYVVTEAEMIRDIRIMKELNINAVRTSHYPDDPRWYDLCDEYGIYLTAEANLESHGMGYGDKTLAKNKDFELMHMERNQANVKSFKNHPSIIVWSMGNEAGYGPNFEKVYDWIKAYDTTRPVQYEQAGHWGKTDIFCPMYMGYEDCEKYAKTDNPRPLIQCEYAHAMGNSMGGFKEYWDIIRKNAKYQGGYIWDFVDQGLRDKSKITGKEIFTYGGDYGRYPASDHNFNCNGIIAPDRRLNPHAYEVRYYYQNVWVTDKGLKEGRFEIYNENFFKTLDDLELEWFVGGAGHSHHNGNRPEGMTFGHGGKTDISGVAPQQRKIFTDEAMKKTIQRVLGHHGDQEIFVIFQFKSKNAQPLIDKGQVMARQQIALTAYQFPELKAEQASVEKEETESYIKLDAAGTTLTVGKWSGWIDYLDIDGQPMLEDRQSVEPEFWRAPTDNDYGARLQQRLGAWKNPEKKLKDVKVDGNTITSVFDMPSVKATLTMTYTLTAEGEVIVREQMNTEKNAKVSGLFRYGVQLQMPKGFDRISYYGRGPVENYCDRNSSEFLGVYNSNASDEYFSYVRPQESGNHTDIRWFRVQNAEGLGLEFYSNAPMEASALKFLTEDLDDGLVKDKKIDRHSGDLTERPQTQVHLQQRQMGMGCVNSWGAWPRKEYRLEYKDYDFTFAIKPVHKTEKK